jgi:subtilisin family serine protease
MAKLRESPMVRSAVPNCFVYAAAVPNDPYYVSSQRSWLQAMNLPAAWEKVTGSRGVTIAVVDTGIRYGHRDLPSKWELVAGWDYVDGDDDPFDPGAPPEDEKRYKVASHGTHVSGTIGALTNNGIGVAGVNWAVGLIPIRVLGTDGAGTIANVASGIRWAVEKGAKVINLSLGIHPTEPWHWEALEVLEQQIKYAHSRGVTVVAASGNEYYSNQIAYPAAYDEVIAVGASYEPESPLTVADFSNGGNGLDLIAPGVGVCSTNYNSRTKVLGYEFADGTSMACPHVAGVVGLMLARNPSLSPSQVRSILRETAIRPGNGQEWDTRQGYGFVNAYAAVTQATLNKVKLMVLDEELKPVSSITAPASNRTFTIRNVPQANTLYVFCWLDVDGSGVLDAGDYTGWVEISTLGSTEVRDVSIRLWVHSSWSASAQEFIAKGLKAMGAQ